VDSSRITTVPEQNSSVKRIKLLIIIASSYRPMASRLKALTFNLLFFFRTATKHSNC
jgi:hypothetical protein